MSFRQTGDGSGSSRKTLKSTSQISTEERKQSRIHSQLTHQKNKRNQLLEQLKRRKVSSLDDDHSIPFALLVQQVMELEHLKPRLQALQRCRAILSNCNEETMNNIVSNQPFLFMLHQLLTSKYSELQLEAAWCITNIAAMREDVVAFCIPTLVNLLSGSMTDVILQEQCVWALGNISLGSVVNSNIPYSTVVIQNGLVPHLVNLIRACRVNEIVKTCLWCISNLIKNELMHEKTAIEVNKQGIWNALGSLYDPIMYLLLKRQLTDEEMIVDLLFALSYLTALQIQLMEEQTRIMLEQVGLVSIKYLDRNGNSKPIIRMLGNIFSKCNLFSMLSQDHSLQLMSLLMNIECKDKEWCYMMSNISSHEEIVDVLVGEFHLMPIMYDLLIPMLKGQNEPTLDHIREVVITLINLMTACQNKHLSWQIVDTIQLYVAPLFQHDQDGEFWVVLEGFLNYLKGVYVTCGQKSLS